VEKHYSDKTDQHVLSSHSNTFCVSVITSCRIMFDNANFPGTFTKVRHHRRS